MLSEGRVLPIAIEISKLTSSVQTVNLIDRFDNRRLSRGLIQINERILSQPRRADAPDRVARG